MTRSTMLSIARARRSVREYDPRPVEDWKLDAILESARLSPSSTNSQPWRFIVVRDPASKDFLSTATPGGIRQHPWLRDVPVVLVLCASPSPVQRVVQVIGKDYHLVDVGIAGEHVVLAAADLGIGSCWIGWIDKKLIRSKFNVPRAWEIVCLISLGYPRLTGQEHPPIQDVQQPGSSSEEVQVEGEPGIGGVEARSRKPMSKIVFHETVS